MSKQIHSFSQLCQEDQVALLKGGCIELMVLRSVMNYDTEKHAWQVIQGVPIMGHQKLLKTPVHLPS